MTASDFESVSMADLRAMADAEDRVALDDIWRGYTETWGAPDLRVLWNFAHLKRAAWRFPNTWGRGTAAAFSKTLLSESGIL